ncbi:uncharacterized protein LOC129233027 [Uloborus diversus]|uniref:uncharacterized protein LOC129233027 n=1 Tax=Uloborus diversus TaxID=327109 RepID=UPI00240A1FD8|nr:uncharacterized protein LOC129233027 [Uloborus diversus]
MYTEEIASAPRTERRHHKSSSKENFMRATKKGKGAIFKNKKRMKESLIKNMEEFRKCVKFDSIVDKIKGVEEGVLHHRPPNRPPRRKRLFLASNVVEKEKIFEDEADDPATADEAAPESRYDSPIHTKSRLVLPFEPRYKRYSEHLRVSRDWTSERRTYSRSRPPDADATPPPRNERVPATPEDGPSTVELSLDTSLNTTIGSGLGEEHDASLPFPAASNEVVCGGAESEVRESRVAIKVEKPDRPVTPSAKFIFYGVPPRNDIFSRFKASAARARQSKEDGIKLPSAESSATPPPKRGRGRPPKNRPPEETPPAPTQAQMCAIGKKIAAEKLRRAKRGAAQEERGESHRCRRELEGRPPGAQVPHGPHAGPQ